MENIKISIIVPVYNAENYLSQCVQSILDQTYKNFEVFLIDDGSSDKSSLICDKYAKQDKRICVIHQENAGASVARNVGLDLATGEYIFFVDADDWLEKNALEALAKIAKKTGADSIGFSFVKEFETESVTETSKIFSEKLYQGGEMDYIRDCSVGLTNAELARFAKMNEFSVIWSKIYKRTILNEYQIRFVDIRKLGSFEDGLFNITFFRIAQSFIYVENAFYHYRKNNISSITTNYKKEFFQKQKMQLEELQKIANKESDAYQSRVAYMAMEYCSNALKQTAPFKIKYKEMQLVFQEPYIKAINALSIKRLPMVWKLYYFMLKCKCRIGVYCLTASLLKMRRRKNRG